MFQTTYLCTEPLVVNVRVSHNLQLFCPRANTNSFLFTFVCNSVKTWNSLPYVVVHAPSVQIFKCRLKQHLSM